jgi:Flp pilus assembly protein TadB
MTRKLFVVIAIFISLGSTTVWGNPSESNQVIVLLDTSGSMRGAKLDSAKSQIVKSLEKGRYSLEIYTFAENVSLISTLGQDKTEVEQLINKLSASSRTSIRDAILYLIPIAQRTQSPIVVISDGQDSQSNVDLPTLLSQLRTARIPVSFLSKFINQQYMNEVNSIIETSGGEFLSEIQVTSQIHLSSISKKPSSNSYPLQIGIAATLLVFILGLRFLEGREKRKIRSTNRDLLIRSVVFESDEPDERKNHRIDRFYSFLKMKDSFTNSKTKKLLFLTYISIFGVLYLLWGSLFIAVILTPTLVLLGIRLNVKRIEVQKFSTFEKELPGALKMLAGSLSAGLSFLQAMNAYAENGQEVSSKEFRRALGEIQLGVPVEKALESIADRMKSEDLRWAVSAFAIQREVGGSLATVLNSTAETIESRFELRREIRTLSAEGRISAYILMALPIGMFFFLSITSPSYVTFFITNPLGILMLGLIGVSLIAAWLWMKSLVRITI